MVVVVVVVVDASGLPLLTLLTLSNGNFNAKNKIRNTFFSPANGRRRLLQAAALPSRPPCRSPHVLKTALTPGGRCPEGNLKLSQAVQSAEECVPPWFCMDAQRVMLVTHAWTVHGIRSHMHI